MGSGSQRRDSRQQDPGGVCGGGEVPGGEEERRRWWEVRSGEELESQAQVNCVLQSLELCVGSFQDIQTHQAGQQALFGL